MIRGLYTAASGMNIQQFKMDVVTHNLSNIDTNGYKKDEAIQKSFAEILLAQQDSDKINNLRPLGNSSRGVILDEIYHDFSQGDLKLTGKNTDLALQGDGFFTIEKGSGKVYTRDGSFTLNEGGCLVTKTGDPVLGRNGRVYLSGDEFTVEPDGMIVQNGNLIDRLEIVGFGNLKKLEKTGDNYFTATTETGKTIIDKPVIKQKCLEKANLVLVDEMVKMIEVSKSYEGAQRLIQNQDQLLGKAVNEVGSVK